MLLTEDILLLGTDDASGRKLARYTDLLVAGGLLSDLALAGNVGPPSRVSRCGRTVSSSQRHWPADPLLAEALSMISGKPNWYLPRWSNGEPQAVDHRLSTRSTNARPGRTGQPDAHRVRTVPTTRWVSVDGRYEATSTNNSTRCSCSTPNPTCGVPGRC